MTQTVRHGAFAITYDAGVVLEHVPTATSVYFCPGDDSAAFLDDFESMQEAAPGCPCSEILARLWQEVRPW